MAKIEIQNAFVEDAKGSPVFVLKIAEPHSRKDDQGNWQTVSRTFFDVKVARDSGIDLSRFSKGDRVQVWGSQKTEVREHEGKKYYTLVVWADRIEAVMSQGGGFGGGWGNAPQQGVNGSPTQDGSAFGGDFSDTQPF